ncbi:response regulator transcription factor [Actinoallomurus spadix]|uniref:Response regulator transcription factor n=1 Tax=Actinoallomurus spadix TaxID=79912 RepID=A0ABN0X1R3_9ACTN|nr:response regulator transcription factor [Actinoallomurus spadix]MCO5990814.1 response regulator transcription factor [Actinoallomurus spadix]
MLSVIAEAPSRDAARARLLLVEDDDELSEMLLRLFTEEGYSVDVARDGQRGLHLGLSRSYDAMIIDRGLPAIDGLDLLARLRRRAVATPVLMLTALGAVADRVAGLDAGAEDYLVKPFEVDELLARIRALRRRHRDSAQVLPLGAGRFDLATRVVTLPDGAQVTLSGREYELLRVLTSRPDQVHTRAALRERVFDAAPAESIVDTYVYYLRTKLGRTVVRTVRGVGYRAGEL